jgi:hypothetical protein
MNLAEVRGSLELTERDRLVMQLVDPIGADAL